MKPFIVAEMSANHLGSLDRALRIVEAAAQAGADAIKVQTWLRGTMCVSDYALTSGPWAGRKLRDLYAEAWLPWKWHSAIFRAARDLGMIPFSAAFDRESVDFLETLGVDRHKVSSFELTDLPLIRHMASKGKPMILSTGMAGFYEISDAAAICGHLPLTLLRCVSAYPADAADIDLRAMDSLREHRCSAGLSDHSMGIGIAVAAAALGATYIEKHLTLSCADGGPDAGFSMEPQEFAQMVTACREAAAAVQPRTGPAKGEDASLRRSLWITKPMKAGDTFTDQNLRTARPALGLSPSRMESILGKQISQDAEAGIPLTESHL